MRARALAAPTHPPLHQPPSSTRAAQGPHPLPRILNSQEQLKGDDAEARAEALLAAHAPSDSDLKVLLTPIAAPAAAAAAAPAAAGGKASAAGAGSKAAAPEPPLTSAAAAARAAHPKDAAAAAAAAGLPDSAVAAVAQFELLYHDAYLSRALQHFDEFVAAHPAIEYDKLTAALAEGGVDIEVLRRRSALVAKGLRECASDEGWRLISDDLDAGGMRLLYRCV